MDYIVNGFFNALKLIINLDQGVLEIAGFSLKTAILSTFFATIIALPLSFIIAVEKFKGKKFVILFFNTMISLPTVVIGLVGYSVLSRRGIFGEFGLLYTPYAIIIGQCVLALPVIMSICISAIRSVDDKVRKTSITLGASKLKSYYYIFSEEKLSILSGIVAGFGRVFSEIGVSMMLGGNIKEYTRTITTAIAFETGKGEFDMGIALGIILIVISLGINIIFRMIQEKNIS